MSETLTRKELLAALDLFPAWPGDLGIGTDGKLRRHWERDPVNAIIRHFDATAAERDAARAEAARLKAERESDLEQQRMDGFTGGSGG